jgi:hypothetical protein
VKRWTILLGLAFVGGGAATAWFFLSAGRHDAELRRLREVIDRLQAERRIAEIHVLRQDAQTTTFRFREVRPDGAPLHERDFTIQGDVVYFDALVIKFEHAYVEQGDHLRGRSLYLFERVFGEHQEPAQGFRLDEGVPIAYRVNASGPPSKFEQELWADFWKFALDPRAARAKGIRVAQGEAVRTKLRKGLVYRLTIEAAGGINVTVFDFGR